MGAVCDIMCYWTLFVYCAYKQLWFMTFLLIGDYFSQWLHQWWLINCLPWMTGILLDTPGWIHATKNLFCLMDHGTARYWTICIIMLMLEYPDMFMSCILRTIQSPEGVFTCHLLAYRWLSMKDCQFATIPSWYWANRSSSAGNGDPASVVWSISDICAQSWWSMLCL